MLRQESEREAREAEDYELQQRFIATRGGGGGGGGRSSRSSPGRRARAEGKGTPARKEKDILARLHMQHTVAFDGKTGRSPERPKPKHEVRHPGLKLNTPPQLFVRAGVLTLRSGGTSGALDLHPEHLGQGEQAAGEGQPDARAAGRRDAPQAAGPPAPRPVSCNTPPAPKPASAPVRLCELRAGECFVRNAVRPAPPDTWSALRWSRD